VKDAARFGLKCAGVHFLKFLISSLESQVVDLVRDWKFFYPLFEPRNFCLGRGDDEIKGIDIWRLGLSADDIDIDVGWKCNVLFGQRLKEGRLFVVENLNWKKFA
jgi:hypothetical protein